MPGGTDGIGIGNGLGAPVKLLVTSLVSTLIIFWIWPVFVSNQVVETVVEVP